MKDGRLDALIGSADVSDPPLPDTANHGTHHGSAPRKSARNRHAPGGYNMDERLPAPILHTSSGRPRRRSRQPKRNLVFG